MPNHILAMGLLLCAACTAQTKLEKELQTPYKRIVDQDLLYIISGEERQAFNRLGTDEEREQFIEQFWRRRDPTPDTEENEYREEHYRRLAYANDRYASGSPGWRSDRGRIYIMYGPADEIESHPSGGSYQRPVAEGGGQTTTFPFEQWRYRYIEGIGTNVIIEFVDPTLTGEYRMTVDPNGKDALQHATRQTDSSQFDRLKQFADLQRPPAVKFKDLEAAISSRITFDVLPIKVQHDFFRITGSSVLTNITVQFDHKDLQFAFKDGIQSSTVNIFGRVTTLTRRPVNTFERTVETTSGGRASLFQESMALPPGSYRLNLVAKDMVSGKMQNYETVLNVPHFEEGKLAFSSLVIADTLERQSTRNAGAGQFTIGGSKVKPRMNTSFRQNDTLPFYTQIYNAGPNATIEYDVLTEAGAKVMHTVETVSAAAAQVSIEKMMALKGLAPGRYKLTLRATDGEDIAIASQQFSIE